MNGRLLWNIILSTEHEWKAQSLGFLCLVCYKLYLGCNSLLQDKILN